MLVDEVHIYEGLDSIFPPRDCGKLWGNHWAESAYRKALTNGYSNSKYAVYARFHLANMMARDPFTSDWRRNVKKDLNEQVMLYQQVIQNGELTGLGVRSMLECGRASIRLKNFNNATDILEQVLVNPASTMEDKLDALQLMNKAQSESCGCIIVKLRLEDVARAFGMRLEIEGNGKVLRLKGPEYTAEFPMNSIKYTVDGRDYDSGRYEDEVDLKTDLEILQKRYATHAFDYVFDHAAHSDYNSQKIPQKVP
jgi:hypothetical protein